MPSRRLRVRTNRIALPYRTSVSAVTAMLVLTALIGISACSNRPASKMRGPAESAVSSLLAGLPQHGDVLGSEHAPVTIQVFGDLECVNVKEWFLSYLPEIIGKFVRTNIVRLEYRSLKTDTLSSRVFVIQQAAALAAGRQDRMWNFLDTFYHEQGREYTAYVTEPYLDGIAAEVPGLDLEKWDEDRTARLIREVVADDLLARAHGLHDTPGFRIGRTGGRLHNFSGRDVVIYKRYRYSLSPAGTPVVTSKPNGYMRPLSLVDARDVQEAISREI